MIIKRTLTTGIGKLNHIAYASKDATKQLKFYRNLLGLPPQQEHGVYTTFVDLGNTKLEFLEPLGPNSPISKFIEKNPHGGVHHVCYEVDDLDQVIKELATHNVHPIEPPKIGAHGNPVIFVHPRDTGGILTEFEQTSKKASK